MQYTPPPQSKTKLPFNRPRANHVSSSAAITLTVWAFPLLQFPFKGKVSITVVKTTTIRRKNVTARMLNRKRKTHPHPPNQHTELYNTPDDGGNGERYGA
ncbi:hypothetical protein, unlikely [Trypanosoma brucei gambiense DAL972]|uniref:Uncharacterized protein n=1 Tax=Trypanosoma brucei gambiense (strain MHOM/CI/86/DAL972) TaxID=679716 RepID=C9ZVD4_TRYB9|nr:hypothetical protein, unlikely [Trypanosoma brucei gambiense DAL972]CBH13372.1 hypothetical protein, unlikely [Trypanosoma brucei gambiense DAL972]|eukprot:XP_011775649.1 hypothetical protein, unlikely [Trypanosoma brucei gambiense DAL972]